MLLRMIDIVADDLINDAILEEIPEATSEEINRAKRAIRRYNIYVEKLKKPPIVPDIPLGLQNFIGRIQTSDLRRPTEGMALAKIIDDEKRAVYETLIHAVDKGIEVASYQYRETKGNSRKSFEMDIRKKLSLEVGKPKVSPKVIKKTLPIVYKAICVCLDAGECIA